jgi:hypothetical protein
LDQDLLLILEAGICYDNQAAGYRNNGTNPCHHKEEKIYKISVNEQANELE